MTENKMRLQLIESTFAALARTRCAEIAHQPETERNGGWGGVGGPLSTNPNTTLRAGTPALSQDVCRQSPPWILQQIDQSPAFKVLLCQNGLFSLKWDLLAENKRAARRQCHTNVATKSCFLHHKQFKGQHRPAVTPLDREMASLDSAAWHASCVFTAAVQARRGGGESRTDDETLRTWVKKM